MENTEAQRAINLATDLSASRQECDMLYRELSKVRDEMITSKTERRVLSRWYEDAKAERDKLKVSVVELEAGLQSSSNLVHAANQERDKLHGELVKVRSALADVSAERDSLRTTLANWEAADTAPFVMVPDADIADHVVPPVLPMCATCHGCGGKLLTTDSSVGCYTVGCRRTMTVPVSEAVAYPAHPYYGPCPSAIAMRHG